MNFKDIIIRWYSNNKRNLPWRHTKNPYFIWLSEIILQQTQIKQGLPYYEKFVKAYPTVFDLAKADEEEVLKHWQGLGYYSRARNLHATSKYIANELNGIFPNNYKELIKLKGVGDYTASAIASFAFNEVKATVDGNVYRLLSRYFGIDTVINSTKGTKEFKSLADSLIDPLQPAIYNQAIMEFGSQQCKPSKPDCSFCPLSDSCKALEEKSVDVLPVKLKKTKIKKKHFNYLVCIDPMDETFFEKREGNGIWQNLYQFPLIETETSIDSENFHMLNAQSLFTGNKIIDYYLFNETDVVHKLSHQHLHTKFWIIRLKQPISEGVSVNSVSKYPMPVLIHNFVKEFNFNLA